MLGGTFALSPHKESSYINVEYLSVVTGFEKVDENGNEIKIP